VCCYNLRPAATISNSAVVTGSATNERYARTGRNSAHPVNASGPRSLADDVPAESLHRSDAEGHRRLRIRCRDLFLAVSSPASCPLRAVTVVDAIHLGLNRRPVAAAKISRVSQLPRARGRNIRVRNAACTPSPATPRGGLAVADRPGGTATPDRSLNHRTAQHSDSPRGSARMTRPARRVADRQLEGYPTCGPGWTGARWGRYPHCSAVTRSGANLDLGVTISLWFDEFHPVGTRQPGGGLQCPRGRCPLLAPRGCFLSLATALYLLSWQITRWCEPRPMGEHADLVVGCSRMLPTQLGYSAVGAAAVNATVTTHTFWSASPRVRCRHTWPAQNGPLCAHPARRDAVLYRLEKITSAIWLPTPLQRRARCGGVSRPSPAHREISLVSAVRRERAADGCSGIPSHPTNDYSAAGTVRSRSALWCRRHRDGPESSSSPLRDRCRFWPTPCKPCPTR